MSCRGLDAFATTLAHSSARTVPDANEARETGNLRLEEESAQTLLVLFMSLSLLSFLGQLDSWSYLIETLIK